MNEVPLYLFHLDVHPSKPALACPPPSERYRPTCVTKLPVYDRRLWALHNLVSSCALGAQISSRSLLNRAALSAGGGDSGFRVKVQESEFHAQGSELRDAGVWNASQG